MPNQKYIRYDDYNNYNYSNPYRGYSKKAPLPRVKPVVKLDPAKVTLLQEHWEIMPTKFYEEVAELPFKVKLLTHKHCYWWGFHNFAVAYAFHEAASNDWSENGVVQGWVSRNVVVEFTLYDETGEARVKYLPNQNQEG